MPARLLDNTAAIYGGAGFAVNDGTIRLIGANVTATGVAGNSAHAGGALAAYRGGDLELVRTTIEGRTAEVGGAVYVSGEDSTLTVSDPSETPARSDISQNTAKIGGAIFVTRGGQATIGTADFSANSASVRGGAIAVGGAASNVTLTGVDLTDNRAVAIGGGLYVASGAMAHMTGGAISDTGLLADQRSAFLGGGAAVERGGSAALSGTSVTGNRAAYGGGLFATGANSSITLLGATITGNSATRLGNQSFHDSLAQIFADLATTVDDQANDIFGTMDPFTPAPEALLDLLFEEPLSEYGDEPDEVSLAALDLMYAGFDN